jgi:AbrB family looped-hinge helix DNA binding protein
MPKVTSKLRVTIPKAIARAFGIEPGDEVSWVVTCNAIRLVPARPPPPRPTEELLALFDAATARQRARNSAWTGPPPATRGWTREDAYRRDRPE